MTKARQPTLMGFQNAEPIDNVLGQLGLVPDLGAFLSDHLLSVLRRQYSDLKIESIEFVGARNCNADVRESSDRDIVHIQLLSLPFEVKTVVTAMLERYSLNLHVVLNAHLTGGKYEINSDVVIKGQTYLGAVIATFSKEHVNTNEAK